MERGRLLQAQECLEHAHRLAPEEEYVLRHLQIIQNRITKTKLTPNTEEYDTFHHIDTSEFVISDNKKNEEDINIVQNHSDTMLQPRNQPLKSEVLKEERYSSRVVETETVLVGHNEDIEDIEESVISEGTPTEYSGYGRGRYQLTNAGIGTDMDDPSSGMS